MVPCGVTCGSMWNSMWFHVKFPRPISRCLDRCDHVVQNEFRDPNGVNVYYVTMQITFLTRKFRNVERNLHCDIVRFATVWVSSLTLDCNGTFAIKAYVIKYGVSCGCM